MTIIQIDEQGPYAYVANIVARPVADKTKLPIGIKIVGLKIAGTNHVGMGKIEGKSNYQYSEENPNEYMKNYLEIWYVSESRSKHENKS